MQFLSKSLLLATVVGFFIFQSCSKTTDLGLSLVELERSDIIYTDTLSLQMEVLESKTVLSSNPARWLIGYHQDPVFGQSEAGMYFNFRISTSNLNFPNATFDSLVLCLQYDTTAHFGDVLSTNPSQQEWEVYRLEQSIDPDGAYKNDTSFTTGALLASSQFIPKYRDTVIVDSVKLAPHLRIRLDDALGQSLLSPTDSTIYANNSRFKDFLKGVYIKATNNSSSIIRFLPNGAQTRMVLYYTQDVDGVPTRKSFSFLTDDDIESVLVTNHDYSTGTVLQNSPTDSLAYAQGLNGVLVRTRFPSLANLGKIVVNKAELVFSSPAAGSVESPLPKQLIAAYYSNSTERYELVDDLQTSFRRLGVGNYTLFGGNLAADNANLYSYKMNISQFFQKIVDNEIADSSVYLQTLTILEPHQISFGSPQAQAFKPQLRLTYTKID